MYAKSSLPLHVPPTNGSCFLSTRTDVLLVIKLKARSLHTLTPSLQAAINSLPDTYDELDTLPWTNFFSVFPTHFTEAAQVGGRIQVSSLTKPEGALSDLQVKEALDEILHGGRTAVNEFLKWTDDRVVVTGGQTMILSGSLSGFSSKTHSEWMETLRKAPAVVGYHVKPLSDLVENNHKKKTAMQKAIGAYLAKAYAVWRREVVKHDEIVKLLEVSKDSLEAQVRQLKMKKVMVARKLEEAEAEVSTYM